MPAAVAVARARTPKVVLSAQLARDAGGRRIEISRIAHDLSAAAAVVGNVAKRAHIQPICAATATRQLQITARRATVLRQNSVGAVCVETSRRDVALFLPFRCNKVQQTAARGGTKRKSKIAGFYG
jgi:hypothetical protein